MIAFSGDPYYHVRDSITDQIIEIERKFHETEEGDAILRAIDAADQSLDELLDTIRAVESKSDRFQHIDGAELKDRRTFVSDARNRIKKIANRVKRKKKNTNRRKRRRKSSEKSSRRNGDEERVSLIQSKDHELVMQDIRDTQDNHLLELENVLGRIGKTSEAMATELDVHSELMDDLNEHIDRSDDAMAVVRTKLGKFLETDNDCHLTTILVLIGVIIFLIILVVYG
jgi:hypothetical protein